MIVLKKNLYKTLIRPLEEHNITLLFDCSEGRDKADPLEASSS